MKLRSRWGMRCALASAFVMACAIARAAPAVEVRFQTEKSGTVSLNLYRPDGTLARRLVVAKSFPAGKHRIAWDGRADDGAKLPPGEYTSRGLWHEGVGLKLRGWAGHSGATPWPTADGRGDWGGDVGVPSAVAADAEQVYLGWSHAKQGKAILACDLEGRVRWSHRQPGEPSGCHALAVDDGLLYVLANEGETDAEGGAIYQLDVKSGKQVPWPNGQRKLQIAALWPANARTKPSTADAMAVRHGRIYLTFTSSEFLAVLDAKTGAYLQTVVGAPPGKIDVTPTKTDLPGAPGKLVDADFAVISLGGGVLGKVLFAHDPLWVVMSELSPVDRDAKINALTVIGDGAAVHRHTAFIGLDAPLHQVQARPLLDMEGATWIAGQPGGRPLLGPWQPDTLRAIRGVALDAAGRLWVAEGDAFPKRFSVWDTSGPRGKLVREFFGPNEPWNTTQAISPIDPNVMFAQGCEWQLDPKTGHATCLGVVVRRDVSARYGVGENGSAYLVLSAEKGLEIFERLGDGDYKLRARVSNPPIPRERGGVPGQYGTSIWSDENGDGEVQPGEEQFSEAEIDFLASTALPDLTLSSDGERGCVLRVQSWSPCGAPRYDLARAIRWPEAVWPSADYRFALSLAGLPTAEFSQLICRTFPEAVKRWSIALPSQFSLASSAALLPAPIGNVWLVARHRNWETSPDGKMFQPAGARMLINEDGFEIARWFAGKDREIRWPRAAVPGAEMSQTSFSEPASLTQGADGKLYLQGGDSAAWNMEVTGLEKVRAMAPGAVILPSAPQ